MKHIWKILPGSLVIAVLALFAMPVPSAEAVEKIIIQVGKTKLLRVVRRPEVIFIANPAIVDIVIERQNAMFLIGRQTGETSMHFLDSNGDTMLEASVVVVPQETGHLTIHRGVVETSFSCNPRCARVANPHAAKANIGGATSKLSKDDKSGSQQAAAIAASNAASAAVSAAAAQSIASSSKRRRRTTRGW